MIASLIRIGLRSFRRHLSINLLNVFGLAVGMTTCLLILGYIKTDLDWDRFNENYDRIMRVLRKSDIQGTESIVVSVNAAPLQDVLVNDVAEVEAASRYKRLRSRLIQRESGEGGLYLRNMFAVDSSFFDIFTYRFIEGNPHSALRQRAGAVLTEETANKIFGSTHVQGQTFLMEGYGTITVTAVIAIPRTGTHQQFDLLFPADWILPLYGVDMQNWNIASMMEYALLAPGSDLDVLTQSVNDAIAMHVDVDDEHWYLQPLRDIHLRSSDVHYDLQADRGDIRTTRILAVVAGFILLIAVINFVNLSTARSLRRAREVGTLKIVGAGRGVLISRFIIEAMIVAAVSVVFAGILVELTRPLIQSLAGRPLTMHAFNGGFGTISLLILFVVVGFTAGFYPAVILSSYQPVEAMKGTGKVAASNAWLRRGLVIIQFAISAVLIISAVVIFRQLQFAQTLDVGYDRQQVIGILTNDPDFSQRSKLLNERLRAVDGVESSSSVYPFPVGPTPQWGIEPEGWIQDQTWMANIYSMEPEALNTLGLTMVQGRFFSDDSPSDKNWDTDHSAAVVLNEAAVRSLGWENPLGRTLDIDNYKLTVIGVVRDFRNLSPTMPIEPTAIMYNFPSLPNNIVCLRLEAGSDASTLEDVQQAYGEVYSEKPFSYRFMDDMYSRLFAEETQLKNLLTVFSLLAIVVAALGLVGLATFAAERRRREIAVRKVLGANTGGLLALVVREFTVLVLAADLVGLPVAFLLMNRWLQNYVEHVDLSWWLFLMTAVVSLLVAWMATGIQAWRAARTNPAVVLRWE